MAKAEQCDPYLKFAPRDISELEENYLFSTYKRYDLFVSHGSGAYLYDLQGRRYLDFLAGIAVNSLGYNHPRLTRVLIEQAQRMIHCSNLFYHPFQGALAKRLTEISGMARVFLTNSGTEAIEAALKISRAYAHARGGAHKSGILTLRNSFHGRTLGALSITAQEKYQAPFRPLLPDVGVVQEFTLDALEAAFNDSVCALVLEPLQGEAGVVPLPHEFLRAARELCDRYDALLVLDEIQTGMGRTGKYFAYQHYRIEPDIVTVAKSLAAGYPLGAVLGNGRIAEVLKPGDHGTTFGGGPLACRMALEVLDVIEQENLLDAVTRLGGILMAGLEELASRHPTIGEVRGMGLMVGVELGGQAKEVVRQLLNRGIVANAAQETVLRLLPPFIITGEDIKTFLATLDDVLTGIEKEPQAQRGGGNHK
jgi:acetylornithine aminotransferase/acetylornithine/N-succinyldiaminopimelate aminotransferase